MPADLRVLVVEDSECTQTVLRSLLAMMGMEALQAFSIPEAERLFAQEHHRLDAIAMDGCVPGITLNTLPLIKTMSKSFSGPIVATSSDAEYRKMMMEAGCTHQCDKTKLHKTLFDILISARRPAA